MWLRWKRGYVILKRMLTNIYLAVFAIVCDWKVLRTVVSDEQIGVIARQRTGYLVDLEKGIQMLFADRTAVESGLWECRMYGVFATMTHSKTAQFGKSAIRIGIFLAAAHLLYVQFLQIIKALSTVVVVVSINFFVGIGVIVIRSRQRRGVVTRRRTKMNRRGARTRDGTRSTHVGGR